MSAANYKARLDCLNLRYRGLSGCMVMDNAIDGKTPDLLEWSQTIRVLLRRYNRVLTGFAFLHQMTCDGAKPTPPAA